MGWRDRLTLGPARRKIADVFSADTQEDQRKRVESGQAQYYADQQRAQGIQRPATNPGAAFLGGTARFVNTAAAVPREIYDTTRMISANVTGNKEAFRNVNQANQRFKQQMYQPDSGLFGAGTIYNNPEEFDTLGAGDLAKRVGASTLGMAGEVLPVGKGVSVAKQGLRVLPKLFAQGGAINAAASAGDQYIRTGEIDPKQVLLSAAAGGLFAAAPPALLAGAKQLPKVTAKAGRAIEAADNAAYTRTAQGRVSLGEQQVLRDFSDMLAGVNKAQGRELSDLITRARGIGDKYGMNLTTGAPRERLERTNVILDTLGRQQQTFAQGGYAQIPGKPKVTAKGSSARPSVDKPQVSGRQRGFVTSVKDSPEVSQQVQGKVDGHYKVRSTETLAEQSETTVKKSLSKATTDVRTRLEKPTGTIDDRTVADSIAVAKAHDAKGNFQAASDVYEKLAEHLTKSGQTVQAASLLDTMTPEGLRFRGMRELKRAGVKVDKELEGKIKIALDEVKKTKPGTPERTYAVQTYKKLISDNVPADLADKLISTWKAGLLTGLRTTTGNLLSNTTFGAAHAISEPLAVALDKVISVLTGKRTKALTARGRVSGAVEGAKKGAKYLETGVDELGEVTNKFDQREIKFKHKALNVYVNGVFRTMGATDKPFRYAQLRASLYDMAKADGLNKGLKGAELKTHVDSFVTSPSKQALQVATDEAAKAVLGNETYLSKLAGRVRQAAESVENPAGRTAAKMATGVLMPFTRVPSAFISRVFDFTPVGAIKEAVVQISKKKLNQRALATALSEATTGTAVIYLGAELANNDLLSGSYPDDPKEQARWKAEGIQPNSVKVGDTWLSLNYFGPVGALFSQGKRAVDTIAEGGGALDVVAGFTGGAVQDALGQSFLQGASGALDAIQDPKRYAQNYMKNLAGSVIPTIVKDVAEATDTKQRATNTAGEAIQARIPGLRQRLSPAQDVYGNELDRKTSSANTMVNPLRPSDAITNGVKDEVRRLHDVDPNNKDLQVTPTPVNKTVNLGGEQVKLTDKQRYDLQKQVGQATQDVWGQIIKTPEYEALDDAGKASALSRLRTDVSAVAMQDYAIKNQLGQFAPGYSGEIKKLTKRQEAIAQGELDLSVYTTKPTGQTSQNKKKTASLRPSGSRRVNSKKAAGSTYKYAVSSNVGTGAASQRVSIRKPQRPEVRSKVASTTGQAKPKVSLKKSRV